MDELKGKLLSLVDLTRRIKNREVQNMFCTLKCIVVYSKFNLQCFRVIYEAIFAKVYQKCFIFVTRSKKVVWKGNTFPIALKIHTQPNWRAADPNFALS